MKTKTLKAIFLLSFLALSHALPQQVLAGESTPKTREGLPGRRIGGGTRGECSLNGHHLTALVPANNLGITQTAKPTLLFYLPSSSQPKLVEFVLQDNKNNVIHEQTYTVSGAKGIIKINLSDYQSLSELTVGKNYRWFFSIICDPLRRENDIAVDGWIQRQALDTNTAQLLKSARLAIDKADIYADQGFWQDAIATLADLIDQQPNNYQLTKNWSKLLSFESLDAIAKEPILHLEISANNASN